MLSISSPSPRYDNTIDFVPCTQPIINTTLHTRYSTHQYVLIPTAITTYYYYTHFTPLVVVKSFPRNLRKFTLVKKLTLQGDVDQGKIYFGNHSCCSTQITSNTQEACDTNQPTITTPSSSLLLITSLSKMVQAHYKMYCTSRHQLHTHTQNTPSSKKHINISKHSSSHTSLRAAISPWIPSSHTHTSQPSPPFSPPPSSINTNP